MSWTNESQKEHFIEAMKNSGILERMPDALNSGDEKSDKIKNSFFRKSSSDRGIEEVNWETISELRNVLKEFWKNRNEGMVSFVNFTVANAFANKGKSEAEHAVSEFVYEF